MAIFNTVPPLKAGAGIKFDGETVSTGAAPRNLLDNSDFRNPVNQRGQTSYTGVAFCIDRWRSWNSDNITTLHDGYISVSAQSMQNVPASYFTVGKKYTVAACRLDDTIHIGSGVYTPGGGGFGEWENVWVSLLEDGIMTIDLRAGDWKWAALYEGEYTAETLPEYQPKGYATELVECKRYFVKYQDVRLIPFVFDGTTIRHYRLNHDIPMRVESPTIDASGLVERKVWADIASQFNFYGSDKNGLTFSATGEVSDNSSIYVAGTITFSAEV